MGDSLDQRLEAAIDWHVAQNWARQCQSVDMDAVWARNHREEYVRVQKDFMRTLARRSESAARTILEAFEQAQKDAESRTAESVKKRTTHNEQW